MLTSFVIVATPGTGVIYTLAASLTRGGRAGLIAAFGCTLGVVPHMAAAITGLAALLHTSAVAFSALKYLGVAYLLYLAWTMLREHGGLTVEEGDEEAAAQSARSTVITAVLINLLNPKLTVFFFAFLPQFVGPTDGGQVFAMLQLSAVFMALTFVVFALYGALAAAARHQVITRPRVLAWTQRVFAGSFVALSAKLALTHQ